MLQQHNFKYLALMAGLVLMGCLITFSMSFAQGDSWTTKAPMPTARGVCASCVLDGKIYVMGGFSSASYPTGLDTVEVFDPQTNTWTTSKELPLPIEEGAACALNGKIYVIGGYMYGVSRTLVEYDPTTQNWTPKAPMPTPRSTLVACVVNGKIYAIGGTSYEHNVALQEVEEYDPMTDSWTTKEPLREPTTCSAAAVVNGKIYVIGGENRMYSGRPSKAVWEYDPASDSWTRKQDMPTARILHVACPVNGMIYAIGCYLNYGSSSFKTNEEYDPETDTWLTRANMPTQRAFFSGGVVDNKIYTIGGSTTGTAGGIVSTVEEYISPTPAPYINYQSYHVDDSEGNNNENPDPGESVKLIVTLRNIRFGSLNVSATLQSHDPDVQISQATANFGDISRNQTNTNQNNPFIFSVAATCKPHVSKFYLDISGSGGYARVDSFQMVIGTPDFLLIDDDGGANYEDYYLKCLPQAKCDVSSKGCPTVSVAQAYKAMIWFTGDDRENTLTSEEQAFLANYLDNGGRLLLTGQDIGYDLIQKGSTSDATFYANYLHAKLISDSTTATVIRGVTGDPLTNGVNVRLGGNYGAGNQTAPDVIEAIAPAEKILRYSQTGYPAAALRYEDPVKKYRLVYFAFGFEGIGGPNIDSAEKLMTNILTWLKEEPTAVRQVSDSRLPEDFLLEQNYPNPFNPTTTISYALAKDSHVKITVYNSLGQVVAVLVDGYQATGIYNIKWDAHNQPSGIYLYKLKAGEFSASGKMFLQK